MDESGVATPPEDTTTSRGTFASRHALATLTTPDKPYNTIGLKSMPNLVTGKLRHGWEVHLLPLVYHPATKHQNPMSVSMLRNVVMYASSLRCE